MGEDVDLRALRAAYGEPDPPGPDVVRRARDEVLDLASAQRSAGSHTVGSSSAGSSGGRGWPDGRWRVADRGRLSRLIIAGIAATAVAGAVLVPTLLSGLVGGADRAPIGSDPTRPATTLTATPRVSDPPAPIPSPTIAPDKLLRRAHERERELAEVYPPGATWRMVAEREFTDVDEDDPSRERGLATYARSVRERLEYVASPEQLEYVAAGADGSPPEIAGTVDRQIAELPEGLVGGPESVTDPPGGPESIEWPRIPPSTDVWDFETAVAVLVDSPISPHVRASALQALADLPDLETGAPTVKRQGLEGVAVRHPEGRRELVIDPASGRVLGAQEVRGGGFQIIREMGWIHR